MLFYITAPFALLMLPLNLVSAIVPRPIYGRVTGGTSSDASNTSTSSPISTIVASTISSSQSSSTSSSLTTLGTGTRKYVVTSITSNSVPAAITPIVTANTTSFCSVPATRTVASELWCRVSVGTVQLHFWPTGAAAKNRTYPSTAVLPGYNVTMTSPSVYYVINTMIATDFCGQTVGPILKNFVTSYDLTDVSTLQPYASAGATSRMGEAQQLQLSDLRSNCPLVYTAPVNNHNVWNSRDRGCNPVLAWRTDLKYAAGEAWADCGRRNGGKLGIFDPPSPVEACTSNNCGNEGAETVTSSTSVPTAVAEQQSSAVASPSPIASSGPAQTSTAASIPVEVPTSSKSAEQSLADSGPPTSNTGASPTREQVSTPIIIATIGGSNTVSATAGASNIVIGSQTVTAGGPAITVSGAGVVSLGSSGDLVVNDSLNGAVATTYSFPTVAAVVPQAQASSMIATIAGVGVISAAAGASSLVIGSQTVSVGGAAITISGQGVVSLSPSGLVLSNSVNNVVSTYALPTAVASAQNVVYIASQAVSISAGGSSVAVIGGQTISVGGAVAILSGNQVVSFSPSGVIAQMPGGSVTTIAVPKATLSISPAASKVNATIAGGTSTAPLASSTSASLGQIIQSMSSSGHGSAIGKEFACWLGSAILGILYLV